MDSLDSAARALEQADEDGALELLLRAWDETLGPSLATLIDEVSAHRAPDSLAVTPGEGCG